MPQEINQGDYSTWLMSFSEYPVTEFNLSLYLVSLVGNATLATTKESENFKVELTSPTSSTLLPGIYQVYGIFTTIATAQRKTVEIGKIEVKPDVLLMTTKDTSSQAKRTLDAVNAVIEKRATFDQQSYTIEGRQLNRMTIKDLIYFKEYYENIVKNEERVEDKKNGKKTNKKSTIYVRFSDRRI